MYNPLKRLYFLALPLLFTGCVTSLHNRFDNGYFDSASVTSEIHAKLMAGLGNRSLPIKVQAYGDTVLLTGTVDSLNTRNSAASIVAGISEVKHVRNNLLIAR